MAEETITQFARRLGVHHRAVQKALAKRIQSWRRDDNGRVWIDADKAVAEWALNTDPNEAAKNGKFWQVPGAPAARDASCEETGTSAEGAAVDPAAAVPPAENLNNKTVEKYPTTAVLLTGQSAGETVAGGSAAPDAEPKTASGGQPAETDFQRARTEKAETDAALAKLQLHEKLQTLVPRLEVEKGAANLARRIRDAILALPDRIAPRLAAETDVNRVHTDLTNELRFCLNGLADGSLV